MDGFYIILPEMSIMEARKLLNYTYCGVDFGDNVLEEFLDVNNNSVWMLTIIVMNRLKRPPDLITSPGILESKTTEHPYILF